MSAPSSPIDHRKRHSLSRSRSRSLSQSSGSPEPREAEHDRADQNSTSESQSQHKQADARERKVWIGSLPTDISQGSVNFILEFSILFSISMNPHLSTRTSQTPSGSWSSRQGPSKQQSCTLDLRLLHTNPSKMLMPSLQIN